MGEQYLARRKKLSIDMQVHDMSMQALPAAIHAANEIMNPEGEKHV
jgi:hypothetical protein